MASDIFELPRSAADAWQFLVGTWTSTFGTENSQSIASFRFTSDRKMIRRSSLSGGVLPFALTNERVIDVTDVAVADADVFLTLAADPPMRRAGVMRVRLVAENQIMVEDGPVYTREPDCPS